MNLEYVFVSFQDFVVNLEYVFVSFQDFVGKTRNFSAGVVARFGREEGYT